MSCWWNHPKWDNSKLCTVSHPHSLNAQTKTKENVSHHIEGLYDLQTHRICQSLNSFYQKSNSSYFMGILWNQSGYWGLKPKIFLICQPGTIGSYNSNLLSAQSWMTLSCSLLINGRTTEIFQTLSIHQDNQTNSGF